VSLGGFSTRSESIGFYDSHAIELVAGAFSLLSAFNFTLWYVAIVRRTLKPIRRSPEVKFFLSAAAVIILITAWQVWHAGMYNATDSLVHAFFLASSMMTDNGLSTADYAQWPPHHLPAVERQLFWRLRRLDLRRDQSPAFSHYVQAEYSGDEPAGASARC
jgi:trk system potassium uptake protein TrkH